MNLFIVLILAFNAIVTGIALSAFSSYGTMGWNLVFNGTCTLILCIAALYKMR